MTVRDAKAPVFKGAMPVSPACTPNGVVVDAEELAAHLREHGLRYTWPMLDTAVYTSRPPLRLARIVTLSCVPELRTAKLARNLELA